MVYCIIGIENPWVSSPDIYWYPLRAVPVMQTDQVKPGQNFSRPGSDLVNLVR